MLIKSASFTAASGSIGGMTASRNRYGAYFRARAVPVNPNTIRQQDARTSFKSASSYWGLLTDEERATWIDLAANTPLKNKIGDTVFITGSAMFLKINAPRIQAGEDIVTVAPSVFTAQAVWSTATEVQRDSVLDSYYAVLTSTTQETVPNGTFVGRLYVSRPVSPTVNFFKGPFRLADTALNGNTGIINRTPLVGAQEGQRFFVRIVTAGVDGTQGNTQILPVDIGSLLPVYNPYAFEHNPWNVTGTEGTPGNATDLHGSGLPTSAGFATSMPDGFTVSGDANVTIGWPELTAGTYPFAIVVQGDLGPASISGVLHITA